MDEQPTIERLNKSYNEISTAILDVQRKMATGVSTPREMAEMRERLSSYYGWGNAQYALLKIDSQRHFNRNRESYKSDKACETAWLSTSEGELYTKLHYMLKGLEKMISALKSLIDTHQHEYNH